METDVFMTNPDERLTETPIDYSVKPESRNEEEEEGDEHVVGESDNEHMSEDKDGKAELENDAELEEPLDTVTIVQQVRTTLNSLNLPQRHLLSIVDCAEGTLCITLQKAGVAWELLHPANRRAFRALSEWVKANSSVVQCQPELPPDEVEEAKSEPELPPPVPKQRGRKKKLVATPQAQKLMELNEELQPETNDTSTAPTSSIKRKRGRPRKSAYIESSSQTKVVSVPPPPPPSVTISAPASRKPTPVMMLSSSRLSVKEFMKSAADDGIVEELDSVTDLDVKALSENVKQTLLVKKMTQETLAIQLGVVLPTLNRILNDAHWLPWSSTNEFRRAVFLKMNAWLNEQKMSNGSSSSCASSMPGSAYTSSDELSKPSVDSAAADLSTKDEEDDDDEYLDTPSSRSADKKFLLLSPGAKDSRQIETVDYIAPQATHEQYSSEDIREGVLIWPSPIGFSCICPEDVIVDDIVNISSRKRDLIKQSRLTLLGGHRYGLVGPCSSGKSALLKLISSKKRTLANLSKDTQIIYCDQQEMPPNASDIRVIAYVRQAGAEDADLLMAAPLSGDLKTMNEFQEGWRGLPETRARRILDGLGFSREMQSSKLRDLSPRWRSRLPLARALFAEPTLLLLDEPTTCLDIDAVLFLENYLQRYRNTLIVVTNCPSLLDHVCTDIIRIDGDKLRYFSGSYRSYACSNSNNGNDC